MEVIYHPRKTLASSMEATSSFRLHGAIVTSMEEANFVSSMEVLERHFFHGSDLICRIARPDERRTRFLGACVFWRTYTNVDLICVPCMSRPSFSLRTLKICAGSKRNTYRRDAIDAFPHRHHDVRELALPSLFFKKPAHQVLRWALLALRSVKFTEGGVMLRVCVSGATGEGNSGSTLLVWSTQQLVDERSMCFWSY